MRSLFLLAIYAGLLPTFFLAPYAGVLTWVWLGAMNPHRLGWGAAYSMPLVMVAALATMFAWLMSQDSKRFPVTGLSVLVIIFILWNTVTTFTSLSPDHAWYYWERTNKSLLCAIFVMILINTRVRIHALIWVLVISLGWFGVKAGLFTVLTGGQNKALGPADSMIADRNHFALAMCMVLPLIYYLKEHSRHRIVRIGLLCAMALTIVGVLGTHSRGGLIALAITLLFFWLKSNRKFAMAALGLVVLIPAIQFMPEKWVARMETIENAAEDGSFRGRLDAWQVAVGLATERPIFSGGFGATYNAAIFQRHMPSDGITEGARAAHSIYFEILGDHGFIGLSIFLMIVLVGYHNCSQVKRAAKRDPAFAWAGDLAAMIQVAMIAYMIAGAALSMAYYETFYVMLAVVPNLLRLIEHSRAKQPLPARWNVGFSPQPAWSGRMPRFGNSNLRSG